MKEPFEMRQMAEETFRTICVRFRPAETMNMEAIRMALEFEKQERTSFGSMQPKSISAQTLTIVRTVMEMRLLRMRRPAVSE